MVLILLEYDAVMFGV